MIRLLLNVWRKGCRAKMQRMLDIERGFTKQAEGYPEDSYGRAFAELNAARARLHAEVWLALGGGDGRED